jgi:CheY-like chemotaxis protein
MSASSNKTLWLIDDDSTFRYVFRCIVESHKLVDEFLEFENGADGYHALMNRLDPKQQPDFIMVDVSMPVLDGWGFLEKLGDFTQDQLRTKIYLISSSLVGANQHDSKRFPLLSGFISKPISVDKICALL